MFTARATLAVWLAAACFAAGDRAAAQTAPRSPAPTALLSAEPAGESAAVVFVNREIVVLRARVVGRNPVERADGARRALEELAERQITGPVDWRLMDGGALVSVASRAVFAITHADVEELSGEDVEAAAARAADRVRLALQEAVEAQSARTLIRASVTGALAVVIALLALWIVARAHRALVRKLTEVAERTVQRTGIADVDALRSSRLLDIGRFCLTAATGVLDVAIVYAAVGFVLREFPYTRPWGESMRHFVVTTAETLGLGIAHAMPGLLTIVIIVAIARTLARLIGFWFTAIERGTLKPRWIYPETAQPTRRLMIGLLWVLTVIVAYPYVPGSQTEAFKGVTVFFGLMVTFGSSGLVNQIMSGFMITYSRALRVGDFVRIGDVEGVVTHLGVLSTKLRTPFEEQATIPNAVVVAQTTTDYTWSAETLLTPTSVTIGYDAPWRQVHALLLLAAERTPGLRRHPQPLVIQAALEDFYVKYTLLVGLERPESRPWTLATLHAHIQDLFNEHGVQIMSPHYVLDPKAPKVVPPHEWFPAPARPDQAERVG